MPVMAKKEFLMAAAIVKDILDGQWNPDQRWAAQLGSSSDHVSLDTPEDRRQDNRRRAFQTAEAFMVLFTSSDNPRFDQGKFLIACGLAEKPPRRRRA